MNKPTPDPYKTPATVSSKQGPAMDPISIDESFSSMFAGTFSIFRSSLRIIALVYAFYLALAYGVSLLADAISKDLSSSVGLEIFIAIMRSAAYPSAMIAMKEAAEKGRPSSSFLSYLRNGLSRLWATWRALLFLGLLVGLTVFLLFVMKGIHPVVSLLFMIGLISVAFIFAVKWSLAFPFIILEKAGILESLRFSSVCVSGRSGRVFGVATVVFLLSMLISSIPAVGMVLLLKWYPLKWWTSTSTMILQQLSSFLLYSLITAMSVSLYIGLRHRKEKLKEQEAHEETQKAEDPTQDERAKMVVACTFVDHLMANELKAELEVAGVFSLIEEHENDTFHVLVHESDLEQARFVADLLRNSY